MRNYFDDFIFLADKPCFLVWGDNLTQHSLLCKPQFQTLPLIKCDSYGKWGRVDAEPQLGSRPRLQRSLSCCVVLSVSSCRVVRCVPFMCSPSLARPTREPYLRVMTWFHCTYFPVLVVLFLRLKRFSLPLCAYGAAAAQTHGCGGPSASFWSNHLH